MSVADVQRGTRRISPRIFQVGRSEVQIPGQQMKVLTRMSPALSFVLLIGAVSFFADFTYEGSRSITGPYLAILGASATAVGIIAGMGELLGYGLRVLSGSLSERT